MAENARECLEMSGNGWKQLENYWEWLEIAENGWKCLEMAGNDLKLLETAGNG